MLRWILLLVIYFQVNTLLSGQDYSRDSLTAISAIEVLSRTKAFKIGFEPQSLAGVQVSTSAKSSVVILTAELEQRGFNVAQFANDEMLIAKLQEPQKTNEESAVEIKLESYNQPLVGALVFTKAGVAETTDINGRVAFEKTTLAAGLFARYLGYKDLFLNPTEAQAGGTFKMARDTTAIPEIVVTAKRLEPLFNESASRQSASPIALNNRQQELLLQGAGFSSIAGINGIDQSSGYAIRGSDARETLLRLDGLPLYQVSHYFNVFSNVNSAIVEDINVYRSHYPIEIDGFRGGLMDIKSSRPDTFSSILMTDLLSGSASVSAKAGNLYGLASGRSTLLNSTKLAASENIQRQISPSFNEGTETLLPSYGFTDGYLKVGGSHLGGRFQWIINGFVSEDTLSYSLLPFSLPRGRLSRRTLTGNYEEQRNWKADAQGIRLSYSMSVWRLNCSLNRSWYSQSVLSDGSFKLENNSRTLINDAAYINVLRNDIEDYQIKLSAEKNSRNRSDFFGLEVQSIAASGQISFNNRIPLQLDDTRLFYSSFYESTFQLARNTISVGLRTTYQPSTSAFLWSPRTNINIPLREVGQQKQSIGIGYSLTNQYLQTIQQENQFGQIYEVFAFTQTGSYLQPFAHNLTLGYTLQDEVFQLSIEGYARYINGVLTNINSLLGAGQDTALVNPRPLFRTLSGKMRVYGVDLDASCVFGPWKGSLAYTLSKAEQRFEMLYNNTWLRAPNDRRHRLSLSNWFEFGNVSIGVSAEGASGPIYNDLTTITNEDQRFMQTQEIVQQTLSPYFRVDAELSYKLPLDVVDIDLGCSVLNITDRQNLSERQYVIQLKDDQNQSSPDVIGADLQLLPRLILGKVRLQF